MKDTGPQKEKAGWSLPSALISQVREVYEEERAAVPPESRATYTIGVTVAKLLQEALAARARKKR